MSQPNPLKDTPSTTALAQDAARSNGLVYVSDASPGIVRVRRGKGFVYLDPKKTRVDMATLTRIRSLAIPPAYTNVWICLQEHGHLQATGRDARGRKQYRYHPRWRQVRDGSKFSKMIEFGSALPRLRRKLKRDLRQASLSRDKVLAVVVTLLDQMLLRVGNEEYARDNRSYGLTTLRDRHVEFLRDGRAVFHFRGKSGREHETVLNDRHLARIVRHCQELPGQQLFQYIEDDGTRQAVDSGLVNDYLASAMGQSKSGEAFTAKDFRTWGATLRAIDLLRAKLPPPKMTARATTKCTVEVCKQVALELGNTPAVCRKAYINPVVFSLWSEGELHSRPAPTGPNSRARSERMALAVLRRAERSSARAKVRKGSSTKATHAARAGSRLKRGVADRISQAMGARSSVQ